MSQPLLLTATIGATNGLAEDAVVMGAAILADDLWVPSDVGELTTAFNAMLNVGGAGGDPPAQFLSPSLTRAAGGIQYRVYDLDGKLNGQPHGSPIAEDSGTLGPSNNGASLPQEVAYVVTLRGDNWEDAQVEVPDGPDPNTAPDRPKQRLTGRWYFGPFNYQVVDTLNGDGRPVASLGTSLRAAVVKFAQDLQTNGHFLAVWSRANAAMVPVTHVQSDNAWDTQRRRGLGPSARVTVTV